MRSKLPRIFACLVLCGLNLASGSDKKGCQLNEVLISDEIFPNFACWKCYENFKLSERLVKVNCRIYHDGEYYSVPGFVTDDEACVPFDHRTRSIRDLVQSSLTNVTFVRWSKCCDDAIRCCDSMIRNYHAENFFNTCDNHWDGSRCFADTLPENSVEKLCPYQLIRGETSKCDHFYTKECTWNGTWGLSDFSRCQASDRIQSSIVWNIAIISVSLGLILPQLLAISMKKKLFSLSLKFVSMLAVIFGLRNFLLMILNALIHNDPAILKQSFWYCKFISTSAHFFDSFGYFYLMLTAIALKQMICENFEEINWRTIIFGVILSLVTSVAWALTMQFTQNSNCWLEDFEHQQHWVNHGVQLVLVLITIFVLVKAVSLEDFAVKLKSDTDNARSTAKLLLVVSLTIFLLPFLLMLYEVIFTCCGWEETFKYLLSWCTSLQLILLALIFFLHANTRKSLFNFGKKFNQGSDASLAPSAASHVSMVKTEIQEPIHNWNDFVVRARNSVCAETFYANGPQRLISTSPDPTIPKSRLSLAPTVPKRTRHCHEVKRRNTIRDIMLGVIHDSPRNSKEVVPVNEPVEPPQLPKIIPNEILDDVQLFDFYYNNLSSIFITESSKNENKQLSSISEDSNTTGDTSEKFDELLSADSKSSKRMSFAHAHRTDHI